MHTIDAQGKKLGRIAGEAAVFLMGKNSPTFERHIPKGGQVKVVNASKLSIDPRKLKGEHHTRYSGYPGGLEKEPLEMVIKRKGYAELVRHAVHGMIPSNRLKKNIMKKLIVTE